MLKLFLVTVALAFAPAAIAAPATCAPTASHSNDIRPGCYSASYGKIKIAGCVYNCQTHAGGTTTCQCN